MTRRKYEVTAVDGCLSTLPILAVFMPVALYMAFPDSPLVRMLFGGWKILVAVPLIYGATHWIVSVAAKRWSKKARESL